MQLSGIYGCSTRIQFSYMDSDGEKYLSNKGNDINLGATKTTDPGDLGVPDGAMIFMHVSVVWGNDNEARQTFLYKKGSQSTASYVISGTTLNNDLGLIDVA
ncbi:hypothetical protein C5472_09745 [Photorhabdus sp. RW14-46]|nr:hypothetical protein [Photorhabdus sp. RW14-46]